MCYLGFTLNVEPSNLYETRPIYLRMGTPVTRFKFETPKMADEKKSHSVSQETPPTYKFGTSPRLVGGTTFVKHAVHDHHQVKLLVEAAIQSMDETRKIVTHWRRQGQTLADIYIHRITDAARLIGVLWLSDDLDFVNCSVAYSRLQRIMLELGSDFIAEGDAESNGLSVLLMTEPGSHHGLGVFMLSEFFRQAGWRVLLATPNDIQEFKRVFLSDWFDAVVLSVATDRHIEALEKAIHELQDAALNPQLQIYVGGPMAQISPDLLIWDRTRFLNSDASQTVQIVSQQIYNSALEITAEASPTKSRSKPQ